jgi:hypothetical protein
MLLPDQTYEQANPAQDILTSYGQLIGEDDEDIIEKKLFLASLKANLKVSTLPRSKQKLKDRINSDDVQSLHTFGEHGGDKQMDEEKSSRMEAKKNEKNAQRSGDNGDETYERTSEFFNNIPEFDGEALGPFSVHSKQDFSIRTNVDLLKACEVFLETHRIRPDFFCKYRSAVE